MIGYRRVLGFLARTVDASLVLREFFSLALFLSLPLFLSVCACVDTDLSDPGNNIHYVRTYKRVRKGEKRKEKEGAKETGRENRNSKSQREKGEEKSR